MNEADLATALTGLREEFDSKTATLKAKIERAKRVIQRSESRLASLNDQLERRGQDLTRRFLCLSDPEPPPPGRRRLSRGSLDQPVLKMLSQMKQGLVSITDVRAAWNVAHPGMDVGRTTIYGVMERLRSDGHLEVQEDGGQGRAKARLYRLASVRPPEPAIEGEIALTH